MCGDRCQTFSILILRLSWLAFCQQLHLNLATQCHVHSVTIGVLHIGHIQTFRCELLKSVAFKTFLWQHKSEILFLIVPIYMQNLWHSMKHHLCTLQGLWSMSLCMYTTCEITLYQMYVEHAKFHKLLWLRTVGSVYEET